MLDNTLLEVCLALDGRRNRPSASICTDGIGCVGMSIFLTRSDYPCEYLVACEYHADRYLKVGWKQYAG